MTLVTEGISSMSNQRPTSTGSSSSSRNTILTVIIRAVQLFFAQWLFRKVRRR
ncbi:MAG: hypothetical protein AELANPGJ_03398 [Anaerolineae bacterium]|jgi:hypothetical protein|nr:MAG: hypothetical protein UZ13_02232 [Chloroflexi bacterium OLB13]MBV6438100.1 hypothetical protein [Anaerolineae bacterium]MEB2366093.1 hypothetical protein [Chloroflexota bacterium]